MVERPIKKSERQAATTTEVQQASGTAQGIEGVRETNAAPEQRSTTPRPSKDRPAKDKDKDQRKGRKGQQKDEGARPPLNPALMRGPKPTKPKPPVIEAASEEQEATAEEPLTQTEPENTPES